MGKKIDTSHVVKLDDTNYQRWKLQVTLVLKAAEVWEVVAGTSQRPSDPTKVAEIKAWDQKDIEGQAIIVPLLDKKQTSHVFNCNSSHEMWEKLRQANSDGSSLNKQHTLSKFFNYKIMATQSAVDAFSDIEDLARALNEMGLNMDETTVVTKIVSALPEENFHAFKKAWDSVPDASQTMPALLARLRKEELALNSKIDEKPEEEPKTAAYAAQKSNQKFRSKKDKKSHMAEIKKTSKCNYCGKVGHWKAECRALKRKKKEQERQTEIEPRKPKKKEAKKQYETHCEEEDEDSSTAYMMQGMQNNPRDVWLSDSGASSHLTGRNDWFEKYEEFTEPTPVFQMDNKGVMALGKGRVRLEALLKGKWTSITVDNVLYIPEAVNLFSESVMAQKGYVIVRDKEKAVYYKGDSPGPEAFYYQKMYIMKFRALTPTAYVCREDVAKIWHDRLSHINMKYIRESVQKEAIKGIKLEELEGTFNCEECHLGKETRKPFPAVKDKRATKPGEMIHADLAGKMSVESLGGASYFLLLKDDCSGFLMVNFLKKKDHAGACIMKFINFIEKQTGNKVKTFRTDNGTEFVNATMSDYFDSQGIVHEKTVAHCPESNGRIEREMRTIKDSARAMLQKNNSPEFLWAEAVAATVYMHNRILNKQSQNITAFEQIFSRIPDLGHAKIFGCKAYAQVPKENRKCWDPKSKLHVFVGYESNSRHYRLYDPERRKIIIARNVSFDEESTLKQPNKWIQLEPWPADKDEKTNAQAPGISTQENAAGDDTEEVLRIIIETPDGEYETEIPNNGTTNIQIPYNLRDRSKLKKPARYEANVAFQDIEPNSFQEALISPDKKKWIEAVEAEYTSLVRNETWDIVKRPDHAKILDARWVFKIKTNSDGSIERYKARLVIKGYKQVYGVDYNETFASVCRYESVRLLLGLAVINGMTIRQFDVKTAFLHGELDEEIYMEQPEGFHDGHEDHVCLLRKSLYGLKQAPRCWSKRISRFLKMLKFEGSMSDPSVFIAHGYESPVYLLLYVDDGLLMSGDTTAIKIILEAIKKEFEISMGDFKQFLGMGIDYNKEKGTLFLGQSKAIRELLHKFNMQNCKPCSVPIQPAFDLVPADVCDERLPYRELIGSLLFIARTTRPDIAYAVAKMSQFNTCYDESHWKYAKSILRYLHGTLNHGISFSYESTAVITGYSDSDYAGDRVDRKSTSGFIFMLGDTPISWSSQKQPVVAVSSTEAEYVALASAAKEAVWLRQFMTELGYKQSTPMDIFVDNTSAIKLAQNPEFHQRSKHIDVRFHFTRDLIDKEEIQVPYVPTTEQKADILTKPLMKTKHETMRQMIGIKGPRKRVTFALAMLTIACLLTHPIVNAISLQNAQPILWRGSKNPVTSGSNRIYLKIRLMNPCSILTQEVLHSDVVERAQFRCEKLFEEYILQELLQMCPRDDTVYDLHRVKREPIFITAVVIVSLISWIGLGTAIGLSAHNTRTTATLAEIQDEHAEQLELLARRLNTTQKAINNLTRAFNDLVDRVENNENDFRELKYKQVDTNFAISYMTSRFSLARPIIKEANRQWKERKFSPGFADFLNLTLPCGDDCPFALATTRNCFFHDDMQDMYMVFDVPVINRKLQLVEADPFELMLQTENKTCKVKYMGPTTAVISTEGGCTYPTAMRKYADRDVVLAPSTECVNTEPEPNSKFFGVDRCDPWRKNDEREFIQIKPLHGLNHIYCPKSTLTIDGKTQECPADVFVLPVTASFMINNDFYNSSQVQLDHVDMADPLFTMKANWHLQPRVNLTELKQHPLVNDNEQRRHSHHSDIMSHPVIFTMMGILIIIILLLVLLVILFWRKHKKIRVSVTTKPRENGSKIEASEISA